jgi:hypothetical protein
MNKKINELNNVLQAADASIEEIRSQLQLAWNDVFKDMTALKDAEASVAQSSDFAWDAHGEIVSWIRFDLTPFEDCKEYFANYMREYSYVEVDFKNDILTYSQGPSIVINEDSDVYDQDSGKFILKRKDCLDDDGAFDETKRNALIEEYMEKQGYFPGVFSSDHYGNVFSVSTITKAKE